MKSFKVEKAKNGYKLIVEEVSEVKEQDRVWAEEVYEEFVFNKSAGLKRAIALLLKEED